ncbi:MAG TPA: NUMOD1 domain-containing DNA-binding protein [Chitinophagaceae bacterium]
MSDDLRAKKAINVVKYATVANMVPVVVEDIHTKEKTEYKSVREAALALGIHNTTLS